MTLRDKLENVLRAEERKSEKTTVIMEIRKMEEERGTKQGKKSKEPKKSKEQKETKPKELRVAKEKVPKEANVERTKELREPKEKVLKEAKEQKTKESEGQKEVREPTELVKTKEEERAENAEKKATQEVKPRTNGDSEKTDAKASGAPCVASAVTPAAAFEDTAGVLDELAKRVSEVTLTDEQVKERDRRTAELRQRVTAARESDERLPTRAPVTPLRGGVVGHTTCDTPLFDFDPFTQFDPFPLSPTGVDSGYYDTAPSVSTDPYDTEQPSLDFGQLPSSGSGSEEAENDGYLKHDPRLQYDATSPSLLSDCGDIIARHYSIVDELCPPTPPFQQVPIVAPPAPRVRPRSPKLTQTPFDLLHGMITDQQTPVATRNASEVQSRKRAILVVNLLPMDVFDLSTVDNYGCSCLHLFIMEGCWIIDKRAVDHRHLLTAYFERVQRYCRTPGATPIHVDTRNSFGETPLYMAVQRGLCTVVTSLLSNGANPSIQCAYERQFVQTPLHCAVRLKSMALVRLFLEYASRLDASGEAMRVLCNLKDGEGNDAVSVAWRMHSPPADDMRAITELLSSSSFPQRGPFDCVFTGEIPFDILTEDILDMMENPQRIDIIADV